MGQQNNKEEKQITKKEDLLVIIENGEINGHLNKGAFRILFLNFFLPKDLCKLSRICKIWYNIISENEFWKEKFSRRYSIDCLDKRDWFDIEYETAKNLYMKKLDHIGSYAPLWVTAFDYVEHLIPSDGGYDNLERKWAIFINNRNHFKQIYKMKKFITAAKYSFPKLINTDFMDGTSVHIEECDVDWFLRLDERKEKEEMKEDFGDKEDMEDDNQDLKVLSKNIEFKIVKEDESIKDNEDIVIYWQTAIMLEGNELAFYRIHVIADQHENMHVYYLRYERSNHHLKVDNHIKSQFEDYRCEDVIDKFSSKDIYSIVKFLTPIVSQFRHLYISEKNLAQFSEAVLERSNKVLKKYFIKLQEQMYIKIECKLQRSASKVLNNLGITETNNHFITFINTIMPDTFSGDSSQELYNRSSSSLISCFKRIIGYLFIKEIRKKSFPTNEDLESLLNYQIWDWASPKKPSVAFDLFTCYILKFLFCNQNTDPFDRLHEVTKKWRVIISTANYINYYPEIHHPWIQLSILTAIPNIAELVETAYSSLVKLKLEEILSISCVKNLLRLGVSLGDLTELISYLPFYIGYSPRKNSSSKLKSPLSKNKTKSGGNYKSPHSSFSSKMEESEETIDLSLVESTEEIIVNEEVSCKDSSDKTTSWGSSFSSFLGIKKVRANDNLSNVSASEEDLKYKEMELNLREKELRDKENDLEKRMKELQLLESSMSTNQNGE